MLENILQQEMTHAIVHISDLFSLLSFIQRKQTTSIRSKYKTNSRRLDSDLELGDYSLELYCLLRSYKLVLSFKGRGSNSVTCSLVQIMRSKNLTLIIPSSCGAVYYTNCQGYCESVDKSRASQCPSTLIFEFHFFVLHFFLK